MTHHHKRDIDRISDYLKRHKLEHVASFLIESHVPAFGLIDAVFLAFQPFIRPFVGTGSLATFELLLKDRVAREYLLNSLEVAPQGGS